MVNESNQGSFTFLADLASLVAEIPVDSIISRTIYKDAHLKAVLFGFAAGQALSEHSAAQPAIIHILAGEATMVLGNEVYEAKAGAWAHMPPHLRHSLTAKTPVTMLLLLLNREHGAEAEK